MEHSWPAFWRVGSGTPARASPVGRTEQARWGAQGLKIWKPFGLHVRDEHGALVAIDDRRLEPLWSTAGELGFPVLIHVADPVAFFDPVDQTNERWEELHAHPDWQFPSPPFPSFMTIMNGLATLVAQHPQTTFIGAHVGCYAENLGWVSALLDRCPNFYVDFSARIAELGRQPYSTRRFFLQYADRILFGTDASPDLDAYRLYYRFLETDCTTVSWKPMTSISTTGRPPFPDRVAGQFTACTYRMRSYRKSTFRMRSAFFYQSTASTPVRIT